MDDNPDYGILIGGRETDNESGPDEETPLTSREASPAPSQASLSTIASEGSKQRSKFSIGARIQALFMYCETGYEQAIFDRTGISQSSCSKLWRKARSRGWKENAPIEPSHVEDAPRSGRPCLPLEVTQLVIQVVTKNSTTRGYSCAQIASEVEKLCGTKISPSSVYRTLKAEGYSVYKRTVKPGLKKEDKDARLAWCLERKDWTLEQWKRIVWTDETSVQLGGVRGRRRVWRKQDEIHHEHVITRRWKGFSEFMW